MFYASTFVPPFSAPCRFACVRTRDAKLRRRNSREPETRVGCPLGGLGQGPRTVSKSGKTLQIKPNSPQFAGRAPPGRRIFEFSARVRREHGATLRGRREKLNPAACRGAQGRRRAVSSDRQSEKASLFTGKSLGPEPGWAAPEKTFFASCQFTAPAGTSRYKMGGIQ